MTGNTQLFCIKRSESTQEITGLLGRLRRASSEIQISSASLLTLTWPWNKVPLQAHFKLWEQARQQADSLWHAFRQLQALRESVPVWQQGSIDSMRSRVQTLVMGIGLAFQYLDEGSEALAGPAYRAVIRTVHENAVWLQELTSQTQAAFSGASASQEVAESHAHLTLV